MDTMLSPPIGSAGSDPAAGPRSEAGNPLLSVSMPAFNAGRWIGDQLEALSLQMYDGPWELVVVDNGSADDTADVVRTYRASMPNLTLVHEPRRGVGRARNRGVEASSGDWLVFIDADDIVAGGWLAAMAEALSTDSFVTGASESETLNEGAAQRFNPFPGPEDAGPQPAFDFLPFASTNNLGVWRSAFEEVGGFAERRGSGNDVDLSWRLLLAGHDLCFAPDAVIHYRYRSSVSATFRQSVYYATAHPFLYRRFARHGMPPASVKAALDDVKRLARLGLNLPDLSPRRRERWLRDVGNRVGRLWGSIRYRTLYL